jgi:protein SCO1
MFARRFILSLLSISFCWSGHALAQYKREDVGSMNRPREVPYTEAEVGVDERLGDTFPLDAAFKDETGQSVTLANYFNQGRPVIVQFGYYECPMLCGLMSRGMVNALQNVKLDVGQEFDVVSISIDAGEVPELAAAKKRTYMNELGKPGDSVGWHFLTGNPDQIARAAAAAGYKFKYIETDREYAHPAVLIVASPTGKITRYLYGAEYNPQTVRLSLVEAANGTIGSTIDKIMLRCFRFDPNTGKYSKFAVDSLRIAGLLTVVLMIAVFVPLWIRSARKGGPQPAAT